MRDLQEYQIKKNIFEHWYGKRIFRHIHDSRKRSKMESFAILVNSQKPFTIVVKRFILNVCDLKYVYGIKSSQKNLQCNENI